MQSISLAARVGIGALATVILGAGVHAAAAADLPAIKLTAANAVPACATPGRLQAYLTRKNPGLSPQFNAIAADYMREGEALGLRWDFAFYQMMLETGHLSYAKGARIAGVKAEQNNFAGLRPIDKNSYESFPDVATGVRAHLQHVSLYTGETVAAPVAQRTRRIQEMGLLSQWRKTIKHEVTFSNLAEKWTDGSDTYAGRLEDVAKQFTAEFCNSPDPQPELVSSVRGGGDGVRVVGANDTAAPKVAVATSDKVDGNELVRRAMETGSEQRSALGAGTAVAPMMPVKILNSPPAETSAAAGAAAPADVAAQATQPSGTPPAAQRSAKLPVPQLPQKPTAPVVKTAAAAAVPKALPPAAEPVARAPDLPVEPAQPIATPDAGKQKCRVYTASYGGQRAVIVKAVVDQVANFTVLDVNEGQEAREAEAFIAAYAKGGKVAGQFNTQNLALDKAFELCPEG